MLKSELIARLNEIPGDPDIVLWNGFVSDWQDIDPNFCQHELVKPCRDLIAMLMKQGNADNLLPPPTEEQITEAVEAQTWDFPNTFTNPEDYPKWYGDQRKSVVMIGGLLRGKSRCDRHGSLDY